MNKKCLACTTAGLAGLVTVGLADLHQNDIGQCPFHVCTYPLSESGDKEPSFPIPTLTTAVNSTATGITLSNTNFLKIL